MEAEDQAAEDTLGGYLELYTRCLDAENAMLLRRTCLMVEWEAAGKAVEKARPNREEAARQAADAAEQEFQGCSQVARLEVSGAINHLLLNHRNSTNQPHNHHPDSIHPQPSSDYQPPTAHC